MVLGVRVEDTLLAGSEPSWSSGQPPTRVDRDGSGEAATSCAAAAMLVRLT
jgi:hypothetical protein